MLFWFLSFYYSVAAPLYYFSYYLIIVSSYSVLFRYWFRLINHEFSLSQLTYYKTFT